MDLLNYNCKFIPHFVVSEIPHKKRRISQREIMYCPLEKLYSGELFFFKDSEAILDCIETNIEMIDL